MNPLAIKESPQNLDINFAQLKCQHYPVNLPTTMPIAAYLINICITNISVLIDLLSRCIGQTRIELSVVSPTLTVDTIQASTYHIYPGN